MEVYVVFSRVASWNRVMGVYYSLADAEGWLERYAESVEEQARASWDEDASHRMEEYFYVEGPLTIKGSPLQALAKQAK